MGLKVYCGSNANRQYENKFFRIFQATLEGLFEQKNLDGILVGYPKVAGGDNLWPDCVLLTSDRIVIIDFKNYDNIDVYLPSNDVLAEQESWRTSNGKTVEGGSQNNANPLVQLKKQRKKMEDLFGGRMNESVGGISGVVLFQGDVRIIGKIPKREEFWFSIADCYNFGNAISDVINVRSKEKNDIEWIRKKYFGACEYIDNIPVIDPDAYISAEKASEKVDKILEEKEEIEEQLRLQKAENKRLREKGESVEEGIKKIQVKEEELKRKEEELEAARENFDEKKNRYDVAIAEFEKEVERTKQQIEKTKQAEINENIEHEKALQEQAKAKRAETELKKAAIIERRKRIFGWIAIIATIAVIVLAIGFWIKDSLEKGAEEARAEQALIEDKKAGKVCVGLDEVADYMNIDNVCTEFIVGNVAEIKTTIYLNHYKNTDFAAVIWKDNNVMTFDEANTYLNKRIRVRGKIKYYEGEKYKYHYITVTDLSQIEIVK